LDRVHFGNRWFPEAGSRLIVTAAVTETASGNQESETEMSVFVNSPYVFSFKNTMKYFKPGLSGPFKVRGIINQILLGNKLILFSFAWRRWYHHDVDN
jgi:hypothetical protein